MTITTKATAKVAAVAAGLAMATSMLSLAPLAHAATACSVGTADLTVGSTGDAVKCLQDTLIAGGYLTMPTGVMTGYFGSLTKTAVSKWQTAMKISPAAGYFGPISRAAFTGVASTGGTMVPGCTSTTGYSTTTGQSCAATTTTLPAGCTSAMGFSPTTGVSCSTGTPSTPSGPLAGTDGTISDVDVIGSYSAEEVGEGQDDAEILGADIEASNDGDIALKSVKVSFDSTGSDSDNLDDYISAVSVWLDGKKIGSADVDEFNENSAIYSKTITLSGETTIRADDTAKLVIAVDGASTFDSGDIDDDSWTVGIDNVRFVDGSGVYTTDSTTGDLGATTLTITSAGTGGVTIDFVSFSASADTDLRIMTDSSTPAEGIVVVDESDITENVSLLKGKLKLEGTADVVLEAFPVTFTVAGTATGLSSTTASVTLKIDGKEYTESVGTSYNTLVSTVTFDNLDLAIEAGETVTFEVLADIEDTDGTLTAGDALTASVTSSNRNMMDVENEEGDQLSDSTEKSGTVTGKTQQFFVSGIGLTLISVAKADDNADAAADTGTFTIKYKVTAIGDTMYVSSLSTTAGVTANVVDSAGTVTTANSITRTLVNNTDTTKTTVGNYEIEEGESENFTYEVNVPNGVGDATDSYRLLLTGVKWDTTDQTSLTNTYTSSLDAFATDYAFLDNA